jgi:hypothetical protein
VNKAIESARRMSLGHILMSEGGKRKSSTRGEVVGDTEGETRGGGKRVKMCSIEEEEVEEGGDDGLHLPPLPALFPDLLSPETNSSRPCLTLQIPPASPGLVVYQDLVAEAKRAIHEVDFCRKELEAAEETVRYARARYDEAMDLAEKLENDIQRIGNEEIRI